MRQCDGSSRSLRRVSILLIFFLNPVAEELFSVITESSLLLLSAIMIVPKLNFPPFSLPFRIYGVKCTFKR